MDEILLIKVDSSLINKFLEKANERILIAKPSLFSNEVNSLETVLQRKSCFCQIIIEEGDNAIRLGFGETEALCKCIALKERVKFLTTDSIRLSMVLVDDKAIFFTPTALSWENEKHAEQMEYPNGIILIGKWVDQIFDSYCSNAESNQPRLDLPDNVVPFPTVKISTIESKADNIAKIEAAINLLEKNKPVDPTRLRETSIYRNIFKLLKIEVVGANVRTKSISLRPFNKYFKNRDERLKSSWQVFTPIEAKNLFSLTEIFSRIEALKSQFEIVPIGRFGNLINVSVKENFEQKIKSLVVEFKGNDETHSLKKSYLVLTLEVNLKNSRTALVDYLVSLLDNDNNAVKAFKQDNYEIFRSFHLLQPELKNDLKKELKKGLEVYIETKLKFPTEKTILGAIDVKLDYYDISDELLNENSDFEKLLKDRMQDTEIRKYSDGYIDC